MALGKRASILCILLVLLEKTDEDHKLTQNQIADEIERIYGLKIERKSISKAIDEINDVFIDGEIEFTKTSKGIYCSRRLFEPAQLAYISDTVFNNNSLSVKEAEDILEKLCKLSISSDDALKARYNQAKEFGRISDYHSFCNYTTISDALKERTQISFNYLNHYDETGKEVWSVDPKTKTYRTFNLSPYYLVTGANGKHYVIGARYYDEPGTLNAYKIEYMRNLRQKRKYQRKNKKDVFPQQNFSLAEYLQQHPKMFLNSPAIDCEILITDKKGTLYVRDEFGTNVKFRLKQDGLHAYFKTDIPTLTLFALDYSKNIVVLSPESVRKDVLEVANRLIKAYSKI